MLHLQTWIDDKRDDLAPYYFTKEQFLTLYGTKCTAQEPTTPEQCGEITTNDICLGGRELYCQFSDDKCSGIVDSICNYYDASGNAIRQNFTKDIVKYLDTLYKMAGMSEYGKALDLYLFTAPPQQSRKRKATLETAAKDRIKTNAFQVIYDNFNVSNEDSQHKKKCFDAINALLTPNAVLMAKIHEQRKFIFDKYAVAYDKDNAENNIVKLPELAMYVFEVMLIKKSIVGDHTLFLFPHNSELDDEIDKILKKRGICSENFYDQPLKQTPTLADLTFSDFEFIADNPENGVLYNIVVKTATFATTSAFYIGNLAVNIVKFVIGNYDNILFACMFIIVVREILGFLVDGGNATTKTVVALERGVTAAASFLGNLFNSAAPTAPFLASVSNIITKLKPIMPYINLLYTYLRDLLCLLSPFITSSRLTQSFIGRYGWQYASSVKTTYNPFPPKFIDKLKEVAFLELIIHALKHNFLQCDKNIRAIGQNRDLVYDTDMESNTARWLRYASKILSSENSSTQPQLHTFYLNLCENPLANVTKLFSVLSTSFLMLTGSGSLSERVEGENEQIAQEGLHLFYALLQGPDAQVTGAISIMPSGLAPFASTIKETTYDFAQRLMELCTLDVFWFVAVTSGAIVAYANDRTDPVSRAYQKGFEEGRKRTAIAETRRRTAIAETRTGGKRRKNRSKQSRRKKRTRRKKQHNTRKK